ncbi:MAG: hypothetical protein GY899_00135 [Verrucomicrobiaceae bacterium]|nr:hypothetical protein [Verrucomicrobiaceae bacterium]
MKRFPVPFYLLIILILFPEPSARAQQHLKIEADAVGEKISVYRAGLADPLLTQNTRPDFRPYLHPITTPDGKGELTQFSPGHHKHQTGLYWGLTRVNGRDYFHHPGDGYWKRISARVEKAKGEQVTWTTVYDMIGKGANPVLRETQKWTMRSADTSHVILDLEWQGAAMENVTVSRYNYGGLFLRMPWKKGIRAQALNAAGHRNQKGEGKRSEWVDVGMEIKGLTDDGHIAIFDHPQNDGFPTPWRIDGQFGFGPSHARLGDWSIGKGMVKTFKHRFIIYTGAANAETLNRQWSAWSGQKISR